MVAKARRILDAPPVPGAGEDGLPADAAAAEALRGGCAGGAAPPGRPRGRDEAVAGQPGAAQRRWNRVDEPISHCLAGNSLLLTGLPGTGKTHLARTSGEAARAGRGGAPGVQDALLRAEPGFGGADGRPLGAQVRARGQRAKAGLVGGGGDHAAGHGALGGPGLRGAERRREVPAAGKLPAAAGRAGLLGRAAHQRAVGAQPTYPRLGAHGEHALRPRHLRLCEVAAGRRGGVPHAGAGQGKAEGALLLQARVDTTLVISHSKRMAVNAAANRALAPEASKLLKLEVIHMGCCQTTNEYCQTATPQTPQNGCGTSRTQGCTKRYHRVLRPKTARRV